MPPRDGYIIGTTGNDQIDENYTGDPDGDLIDNLDAIDPAQGDQDAIFAGDGNDHVQSGLDDDLVVGGDGDDMLRGEDGDDVLIGDGPNTVAEADGFQSTPNTEECTDGGNDTIYGGAGNDIAFGGGGDDVISGDAGNDLLFGGDGNDTVAGNEGDDVIYGDGANGPDDLVNLIVNGSFEDTSGLDSTIYGYKGTGGVPGWTTSNPDNEVDLHTLRGGVAPADGEYWADLDQSPGNIILGQDVAGVEAGQLYTLTFSAGDHESFDNTFQVIWNGQTVDIDGSNIVDPVDGGMQEYTVTLEGGTGDGSNRLEFKGLGAGDRRGVSIDDVQMYAVNTAECDGDDTIFGDDGEDLIYAGNGQDFVNGGADDDVIYGDDEDLGTQEDGEDPDACNLWEGQGANGDTINGGSGNDTIFAMDGHDFVNGEAGDDWISGGSGNDHLKGWDGNDTLVGGEGEDCLEGGADRDRIVGGEGDRVDGGSEGDDYDTLVLNMADVSSIEYTSADNEDGIVHFNGGGTLEFEEIENIVPCFTPGTLILTARGETPVEQLRLGDRVVTRDNGLQEVRWIGTRALDGRALMENEHLRPILIRKGSMGKGLPERDMMVSPNHRMLVANDKTNMLFEDHEVLVSAKHLVDGKGVQQVTALGISYVHMMFDQHEVVLGDGAWTESFQPGDYSLKGIGNAQREEIFELFPELKETHGRKQYVSARRSLKRKEAQLLM